MEINNAHHRRLRRRQAVTPFEFIDGCDILPQSRQSYFQLHGGHHADATDNAVTMHRSGLDIKVIREIKKSVPLLNSEGNSYYQAGDFNQAIISFTAAIRKILNTDGEDTALLAHFRSLSQRSEAYLALSNFEQAHTDARNALDLYNNCGYYFSAGLHPGELAAAIDRVKRTMLAGLLHHAVGNSASVAGHSSYKKKSFHRRCQWAFI
jgi:tetratricopeptide (TPR) repeat protein